MLSEIDINALYKQIAQQFIASNQPFSAIHFLMKIAEFEHVMEIYTHYHELDFCDLEPALNIELFTKLPDYLKNKYPYVYLKWIINCITNFPQFSGKVLLEDFKERIDSGKIIADKNQLYREYHFVHAFTYFNDIYKMIEEFKKAEKYFNGSTPKFASPFMITTLGSHQMSFLYYTTIGKYKNTTQFIYQNVHHFNAISNGIHAGSEHLVLAEYYYETGQFENVESNVQTAYNLATMKQKMSARICCLFLQVRLAILYKQQNQFEQLIKKLESLYEQINIEILVCELDCALSHLFILNNQQNRVSEWLKRGDFTDKNILPEGLIAAYIVHGLYLAKERNAKKLSQVAETIELTNDNRFAMASVYVKLFQLISLSYSGLINEASNSLKQIIQICAQDNLFAILLELSFGYQNTLRRFHPETAFEIRTKKRIEAHFEAYPSGLKSIDTLTKKEREVLSLYAQNLSRNTVAERMNISTNTVLTHLKNIYKKLNIKTKSDAIQYYNNNLK